MAGTRRKSHNHLPQQAYQTPRAWRTTWTLAQLQETLLATEDNVMAAGYTWRIQSARLAPGIYEVSLVRRDNKAFTAEGEGE